MKFLRKMLAACLTLALVSGMVLVADFDSKASSVTAMIDGSYLTHEEESIGYAVPITRGEDLLSGYSKSVRLGPGLLYAGGTTVAADIVDEIGVAVIVERAVEGDDAWGFYDSWSQINYNTDRVSSNLRLTVEGGYYYRVRCTHSANSDMSSSFTDGVYIESPTE